MSVLPNIKAKYDNYIHFDYIKHQQKHVTHMYTVFYMYLHEYNGFYSFVLMMLSSPESEKSMRLISTVFTVLRLNCIG